MASNDIKITVGVNKTNSVSELNAVEAATARVGKQATTAGKQQVVSANHAGDAISGLRGRFYYMSMMATVAAGVTVAAMASIVKAATTQQDAYVKLAVYSQTTGTSSAETFAVAQSFVKTGLISAAGAATVLSNILATGIGLPKATKLMQGMMDSAVLAKESLGDNFEQAMIKSSVGIRTMQERNVDAIGINFVAIKVWQDYAKTVHKTTNELTVAEKQLAIVNYVIQESARFAGGTEIAMQTFGGTLAKAGSSVTIMSAALGNTLMPVVGMLADLLISITSKITAFSSTYPVLTAVVLTGVTALALLAAIFATIGVITPMVAEGIDIVTVALTKSATAAGAMILRYGLIALVLGTIIYLIADATGYWDKFTNAMDKLAGKIKDTMKETKNLNDTITDPKVLKQIAKLNEQMTLTTRDFNENMAQWVVKHDKATSDIKKDIETLEKDYKKAVDKINSSFDKKTTKDKTDHQRRIEDLQKEIDDEVSKGIWADQTKIAASRLALKRENEDYAASSAENLQTKTDDLDSEQTMYDEKMTTLKANLKIETDLYNAHTVDIATARLTPLLDEIDLQKRQYDEKMTQLKEQLAEIQADSLATIAANSLVAEKERQEIEQTMIASDKAQRDQKNSIETIIAGLSAGYVLFLTATAKAVTVVIGGAATAAIIAGKLMLDSISQSKVAIDDLLSATTTLNNNTIEYIKKLKVARQEGKLTEEEYTTRVKNAVTTANNANKEISTAFDYQIKVYNALIAGLGGLSFGIIPKILGISPKAVGGPVSANTPYLVGEKGPELFIPNQSGNIRANGAISTVININNPSVRSNQDIQDIANAVSAVLSRKTYLSRFA